jgi:hypothetical protein
MTRVDVYYIMYINIEVKRSGTWYILVASRIPVVVNPRPKEERRSHVISQKRTDCLQIYCVRVRVNHGTRARGIRVLYLDKCLKSLVSLRNN